MRCRFGLRVLEHEVQRWGQRMIHANDERLVCLYQVRDHLAGREIEIALAEADAELGALAWELVSSLHIETVRIASVAIVIYGVP